MPSIIRTDYPPTNRRTAPRRQPTLGTVCRFTTDAPSVSHLGLVWNISAGGVSMLLNQPPARGSVCNAVLATVDEQCTLAVTLQIVHVLPIRTGDFVLGAQFQRPLNAEEMRPFLADPV